MGFYKTRPAEKRSVFFASPQEVDGAIAVAMGVNVDPPLMEGPGRVEGRRVIVEGE